MEVFEHEYEWALVGDRLEIRAPGCEPFVQLRRSVLGKSDECAEMPFEPVRFGFVPRDPPDRVPELGG